MIIPGLLTRGHPGTVTIPQYRVNKTKQCTPDQSLGIQETVPDHCRPKCKADHWVKKVHNICGLACILGLTSLHNQVSLFTKKRGAQGMVTPHSGRKSTKSTECPPSIVHHTYETRYSSGNAHSGWASTTSLAVDQRPAHWKDRDLDHTYIEGTSQTQLLGTTYLGKPSRLRLIKPYLWFSKLI